MSIREADIARHLTRWLVRYAVPMHMRDKPEASQAEAESLARVLCKLAPEAEYIPFLNQVFDQVDFEAKTRAWPTIGELGAACSNVRKNAKVSGHPADGLDMRPIAIVARKMMRGEPVNAGYLWGKGAVELIAERLVDKALMLSYRKGAFSEQKAVYGDEVAQQWEADARARHKAAKDVYRSRNEACSLRKLDLPTKSAMPPSGVG